MTHFEEGTEVLMQGSIYYWTVILVAEEDLLLSRRNKSSKQILETRWCPKEWATPTQKGG